MGVMTLQGSAGPCRDGSDTQGHERVCCPLCAPVYSPNPLLVHTLQLHTALQGSTQALAKYIGGTTNLGVGVVHLQRVMTEGRGNPERLVWKLS